MKLLINKIKNFKENKYKIFLMLKYLFFIIVIYGFIYNYRNTQYRLLELKEKQQKIEIQLLVLNKMCNKTELLKLLEKKEFEINNLKSKLNEVIEKIENMENLRSETYKILEQYKIYNECEKNHHFRLATANEIEKLIYILEENNCKINLLRKILEFSFSKDI